MIFCPVCGKETSENFPVCTQCGSPLAQRGSNISNSRLGVIIASVLLSIFGLIVVDTSLIIARYVHWLKSSPAYGQAMAIASASTEVRNKLGSPLREGWIVYGTRKEIRRGGYTQLIIPISGPLGEGKVFAVSNQGSKKSVLESVLFSTNNSALVDLTPTPDHSDFDVPGAGRIYLVPLGDVLPSLLADLPRYYNQRFGLDVRILSPMPLDQSDANPARQQEIAEKLVDVVRSAPEVKADSSAVVIGVTNLDMYIAGVTWRYALSYRADGQYGVVSTKRMESRSLFGGENPAIAKLRMRRMITKDIGLLRQLPVSKDPTSALYYGVNSASDLDLMGDDFAGADGSWDSYVTRADACVSVMRFPDGHLNWISACTYNPPADTHIETFENDLTGDLVEEQRTDFNSGEAFPLTLIRKYRPQDDLSHEFGIGASHSLDIWLYGDPAGYVAGDIMLPDSARMHFVRVSPGTDRDGAVFRMQAMNTTPYEGAVLRWNGNRWDLQRNDGWTMVFPDIDKASVARQAALIGLHDEHGHAFEIVRDSSGNLMNVKSPWGYKLDFTYDSAQRTTHAWDSRGQSVSYFYDKAGRLISVTYPEGETVRYQYDGKNQMTSMQDGTGKPFLTNEYDPTGRLVRQTLADGRILSYSYTSNSARNPTVNFTDPEGYQTEFKIVNGTYTQSLPVRHQRQARVSSPATN
jgi:YD repeat-containing protein